MPVRSSAAVKRHEPFNVPGPLVEIHSGGVTDCSERVPKEAIMAGRTSVAYEVLEVQICGRVLDDNCPGFVGACAPVMRSLRCMLAWVN